MAALNWNRTLATVALPREHWLLALGAIEREIAELSADLPRTLRAYKAIHRAIRASLADGE